MYDAAIAGILAVCLSKWAQKADIESAGVSGNGFPQTSFGTSIFTYGKPGCLRVLFPLILFPRGPSQNPTEYGKWYLYQALRAFTIFLALLLDSRQFGSTHSIIVAILFGLTLRYDYWSNGVELLASVIAYCGLPWWGGFSSGLVLGLGRETLPFLALLGPAAFAIAGGSLLSTLAVRRLCRTDQKWRDAEREELQYGQWQWQTNLLLLRGIAPHAYLEIGVFMLIASLSVWSAPLLSICLVVTTTLVCRIDEPRVLTMLLPSAATTALLLWR